MHASATKRIGDLLNELLNNASKTTIINDLIVNKGKIVGDENIAEEFNSFFSRIGTRLSENIDAIKRCRSTVFHNTYTTQF
jgi:hypothetical protein